MTKSGERMLKSAREALAIAHGEIAPGALHTPEEIAVRALRKRDGLSQAAFAARYGIDLRTLQDWEQSRTTPNTAAQTLLKVIRDDPEAVHKAVAAAALTDAAALGLRGKRAPVLKEPGPRRTRRPKARATS